jgi:hypothetical protein
MAPIRLLKKLCMASVACVLLVFPGSSIHAAGIVEVRPAEHPYDRERTGETGENKGKSTPESALDQQYPLTEVQSNVFVRAAKPDRTLGTAYGLELIKDANQYFDSLRLQRIDISKLRLLSLVDNVRTEEAIFNSPLASISKDMGSADAITLHQEVSQATGNVLLVLGHITLDGNLELGKENVAVADLYEIAKRSRVPLIVVGCYSESFGPVGYKNKLDSAVIADRLAEAIHAEVNTFGSLLTALSAGSTLVVDWRFLLDANGVLAIRVLDKDNNEEMRVYAYGISTKQLPLPSQTGLHHLIAKRHIPFWLVCTFATFVSTFGLLRFVARTHPKVAIGTLKIVAGITVLVSVLIVALLGMLALGMIFEDPSNPGHTKYIWQVLLILAFGGLCWAAMQAWLEHEPKEKTLWAVGGIGVAVASTIFGTFVLA